MVCLDFSCTFVSFEYSALHPQCVGHLSSTPDRRKHAEDNLETVVVFTEETTPYVIEHVAFDIGRRHQDVNNNRMLNTD